MQLPGELDKIDLSQANGIIYTQMRNAVIIVLHGLLCGSCSPEYSLSLGSAKCILTQNLALAIQPF